MLTEEGHHMFVGRTGVERIIRRTCEVIQEAGIAADDINATRKLGVIDLPTIQKKINFHISVTEDLFGAEVSTNAANAFNAGLKGRFRETSIDDDHQLHDSTYPVWKCVNGALVTVEEPALNAINARLADDYIKDCEQLISTWNRAIKSCGIEYELKLPHRAFNRQVGEFADIHASPDGKLISAEEFTTQQANWLANASDLEYLLSLMEEKIPRPGEYSNWIAPPKAGINGQPVEFEYVKIHQT
jgi:benzoyl-CoA 2,3-dioxygenase component B